jgi:hypothetical protein
MIAPLLFSELIKRNRIKPDAIIVQKIDEIDFPLKHIKFIKKDINNLIFNSFTNIVERQKKLANNEQDLYNNFNTEYNIQIELNSNKFEILVKKNKKDCINNVFQREKISFDENVLTDDFIEIINKYYILTSLTIALSLYETDLFIQKNKLQYNLNSRFIADEILSFWSNSFKTDFCYFNPKDVYTDKIFEEREIEYCLLQFYYNFFKKELLDISFLDLEKFNVINSIINDKSNTKWYVIFGTTILDKINDNFKNKDETIFDGLKRIKELNYRLIEKIFDDIIN